MLAATKPRPTRLPEALPAWPLPEQTPTLCRRGRRHRCRQPDASDSVRFHVLVRGLVQGVWFRESTRHEATRLGVCGWVRNLPDGRVEAVFEGTPAAVEAMLAWAERGPVHARVDGLTGTPRFPGGSPGSGCCEGNRAADPTAVLCFAR